MTIPIFQVDAFTDHLFGGNPAAVCPLENWLESDILQNIANENNLSETAFLVENNGMYELRWFTPTMEVDLCGHATLATAHVLFNHLNYPDKEITFQSKSGKLKAVKASDYIQLDFPAWIPEEIQVHKALDGAFNLTPKKIYKTRDLIAVFEKEDDIIRLSPDFSVLKTLEFLGIIVTAPGDQYDFVSRYFAPRAGINEDPVTGSAHSSLIPLWARHIGKNKMKASQLSDRKGILFCELSGDRVLIGGETKTFMEGKIRL